MCAHLNSRIEDKGDCYFHFATWSFFFFCQPLKLAFSDSTENIICLEILQLLMFDKN